MYADVKRLYFSRNVRFSEAYSFFTFNSCIFQYKAAMKALFWVPLFKIKELQYSKKNVVQRVDNSKIKKTLFQSVMVLLGGLKTRYDWKTLLVTKCNLSNSNTDNPNSSLQLNYLVKFLNTIFIIINSCQPDYRLVHVVQWFLYMDVMTKVRYFLTNENWVNKLLIGPKQVFLSQLKIIINFYPKIW